MFVTIAEAASQSIYTHEHIAHLVRTAKINGRKSGNMWLVDMDSLRQYESKMEALGPHKHNPVPSSK